jgi:hypothetical protein
LDGPLTGISRVQHIRRRSLLLQMRIGLASCLRDAVTPHATSAAAGSADIKTAAAAAGGDNELLVCVGHQAQVGSRAVNVDCL